MYPENVPFPVYQMEEWWKDSWDPLDFGQEFDFNRGFFEQWKELDNKVPKVALNVAYTKMENSDFNNYSGNLKNCYLLIDSDYNKDCQYCYTVNKSRDVFDSLKINECELCYECIDCTNCYNLKYSQNCRSCNDSYFLKNCTGCNNCFSCMNLQNKKYCIFNEQLTEEEYAKKIAQYNFGSYESIHDLFPKIEAAYLKFPNKYMRGFQNQNVTGEGVFNSKNTFDSYDCLFCEDVSYCYSISFGCKTSRDVYQFGEKIERAYESVVVGYSGFNVRFCHTCNTGNSNLEYCHYCTSCKDCFGCIGMRHKQYCILNKQYSEQEYKNLIPKIIEQMKAKGEYGEFFPASLSPFGYNTTTAQDFYPLEKQQAVEEGYNWEDPDEKEFQPQSYQIPDHIDQVEEVITEQVLACETCSKNYKINDTEYKFYKRNKIPIPHKCFTCRHRDRMKKRNPFKLWDRQCQKCSKEIKSSYEPQRPEIVYCEECYLGELT